MSAPHPPNDPLGFEAADRERRKVREHFALVVSGVAALVGVLVGAFGVALTFRSSEQQEAQFDLQRISAFQSDRRACLEALWVSRDDSFEFLVTTFGTTELGSLSTQSLDSLAIPVSWETVKVAYQVNRDYGRVLDFCANYLPGSEMQDALEQNGMDFDEILASKIVTGDIFAKWRWQTEWGNVVRKHVGASKGPEYPVTAPVPPEYPSIG